MSSQISALQDQVVLFNQLESQVPQWLRKETNKLGGEPKSLSLKMMTAPKYENLLADCELPQGDAQNLKNSKVFRKYSQKAVKDGRNSSYNSTSKSFKAMLARSKAQNPTSRLWGKAESRVKESTMIQTLAQDSLPVPALPDRGKADHKDFNISVTESILFPFPKAATLGLSRTKPMSLREQIVKKQRVLWSEWEKTERYHQKMGQWMGEAEAEKMLHTMCPNSRVVGVIQKIRSTRPESCRMDDLKNRKRIKSDQL
jgi:uncharacterized protein YifE (UPF0438 family)